MTVRSFPFFGEDASEDDYYRLHRESGVLSGLNLTLSGLGWSLSPGEAKAGGSMMLVETSPVTGASIATTGATPRRDMLVARRTLLPEGGSETVPGLIQGTTAATPVDPTPSRETVGVFEEPLFSWQVPGGGGTGTTGIVDLRATLLPSGLKSVLSIAARDAHFPAPVKGDICMVDGIDHVYNGSRWVFSRSGQHSTGTDGGAVTTFIHDLGVVPITGQITRGGFPAASIADCRITALSTTQGQVVWARTDTGAALPNNPVFYYWGVTA